jgi:uncharacterized FlaG/YvyC family protein
MKSLEEAKEAADKAQRLYEEQNKNLVKQLNDVMDKVNVSGENL